MPIGTRFERSSSFSCKLLTIQNGTTEVTDELNEDVGLLSSQLVPATLLTARLNVRGAQTGTHVGLEPLIGALPALLNGVALLAPELPPRLLTLSSAESTSGRGRATTTITGSRDVAVQSRVLIKSTAITTSTTLSSLLSVAFAILDVDSIGDPPLARARLICRHCCSCCGSQAWEDQHFNGKVPNETE